MWQQILPGLRIKLYMTILLGVVYPLAMTGISQVLFPHQANGSLIMSGDKVIGSELIGQNFAKPEYFHPRPSAAGNDGYDPMASGGSNYGPTREKLVDRVKGLKALGYNQIGVNMVPGHEKEMMQQWSEEHCVELLFIQPGKPTQNAYIESFNARVRALRICKRKSSNIIGTSSSPVICWNCATSRWWRN